MTCGASGEISDTDKLDCPAPYTVDRIAASLHWGDERATDPNTTSGSGSYSTTDDNIDDASTAEEEGFHVYRLEWEPGESLQWFVDGTLVLALSEANLHDKTGANIPQEPMYLFAAASVTAAVPPSSSSLSVESSGEAESSEGREEEEATPEEVMVLDYVRVYQVPGRHSLGCSPEDYPTEAYIHANPSLFEAWAPRLTPFATSKVREHNFGSENAIMRFFARRLASNHLLVICLRQLFFARSLIFYPADVLRLCSRRFSFFRCFYRV